MKRVFRIAIAALLGAGLVLAQANRAAEADLKNAQHKAEVEGDLNGAIKAYRAIVAKYKSDRTVAATALMRMAECYQKLGKTEARETYEQVIRDYADQIDAVTSARAKLAGSVVARENGMVARQIWKGTELHFTASLGPDGRSWATLDTATGDLAIRDLVTSTTKRMMLKTNWTESGEYCAWPLLSPDQKRIVYSWFSTQGPRHYELRVVDAEPGAKPRVLVRNPEFGYFEPAAWARDGRSVLVGIGIEERATRLVWISLADGSMKPLKSVDWREPGRPSLSPDGKFLAYDSLVKQGSMDREIRIIAADGSGEMVAAPAPGVNESPIWTPDGTRLVFTSNRSGTVGLWSIAVRDGKAVGAAQLAKPDIGDILPKGFTQAGSLYYIQRRDDVDAFSQELDPTTGKLRGVPVRLADSYLGRNSNPAWSADGESVAYFSSRVAPLGMVLVIRSLKVRQERTFPVSFEFPGQPMWSPDGQHIIVAAQDRQWRVCLYSIDLKTGEVREALNTAMQGAANAVLSPDGKTAFLALRTQQNSGAVVAFDLDTGKHKEVYSGLEGIPSFAMSRDGKLALMVAPPPGSRAPVHLFIMQADGSGRREIYTQETGDRFAHTAWTPDGSAIYFCQFNGRVLRLWRIPVNGGAPEDAGVLPGGPPGAGISVSGDGTRLAFNAGARNQGELWALDNLGAVLMTPGK